jgi:hypothetical protein
MRNLFLMSCISLFLIWGCVGCKKDAESRQVVINQGTDPNFKIVANQDGVLETFTRKVVVFGIDIYAVPNVTDARLLHAANVMAQYIDNDEDETIDNQIVVDKMLENKAFVVMWKSENDLNIDPPDDREGQDLGNDETNPNFVLDGKTGDFDASLEEIWHIITHAGFAYAYPEIFGEGAGTALTNAMDIARGGNFTSIPDPYPSSAWYSYDDASCTYDCQATEYFYWAMTSMLGAQENRLDEIGHEWKLNTKELVQSTDESIYVLLSDVQYKLPTVLPDGKYKQ